MPFKMYFWGYFGCSHKCSDKLIFRQQFEKQQLDLMNYQQGKSRSAKSASSLSTAKMQLDDEDTRHDSTSNQKGPSNQQDCFHRIAANSFRRLAELYEQTTINPFDLFNRVDITTSLETIKEQQEANQKEECQPIFMFDQLGVKMTRTVVPKHHHLQYDQIGHYRIIKAVQNSISRLTKMKLAQEGELDAVAVGLLLVCLGYIQCEKGTIKQEYLQLWEQMKEIYRFPNGNGVIPKNIITFLCLVEGNIKDGGDDEKEQHSVAKNQYGWFTQKRLFVPADPEAIYYLFSIFRETHLKYAAKELKQTLDLQEAKRAFLSYKNIDRQNGIFLKQNSQISCLKSGQRMFKLPVKRNKNLIATSLKKI